jgi:hypothetical protein
VDLGDNIPDSRFISSDFLELELRGFWLVLTSRSTRIDVGEHRCHETPNGIRGSHADGRVHGGSAGPRKSVRRSNLASRYRGHGVPVDGNCGDFYRLDARYRPVRAQKVRTSAQGTRTSAQGNRGRCLAYPVRHCA